MKNLLTFEDFINEGSMSRTHVVFSINVETKDGVIFPDFRVTVLKGVDAEERAINLTQEHFGKDFLKVRSVDKAMNPKKYSIKESQEIVNEFLMEDGIKEMWPELLESEELNEKRITIDDKDGEIIYTALQLAYRNMTRNLRLSTDETKRLNKLMSEFGAVFSKNPNGDDASTDVDATAAKLNRR